MAAQPQTSLSDSTFSAIDAAIAYVDLEINPADDHIFRLGILSRTYYGDFRGEDHLAVGRQNLKQLNEHGKLLCGHNFRRFDAMHLAKEWPELQPWPTLDTLELSILTIPLAPTHRLDKDYKPSDLSANNPYQDARDTRIRFRESLTALAEMPPPLRNAYVWLLSCGNEEADYAYRTLFSMLGWIPRDIPPLSHLPSIISIELDSKALSSYWDNAPTLPFDVRLCIAAILAWVVASGNSSATRGFSLWLQHLPPFHMVLDALRPLQQTGFTYQSYLEYFGLDRFRNHQEEAVQQILAGNNPLVLMSTGGGKSLCYQLPALMLHLRQRALTVVLSPLQALMEDQVRDLEAKGLTFATFINSTVSASDRKQRLDQLWEGSKGLLYISPEQLRSVSIRRLLKERIPALWVIDEAHCISQWGHDFRPDYRYIPKYLAQFSSAQLRLALMTATATDHVREDIKGVFAQHNIIIGATINAVTSRENLRYMLLPVSGASDDHAQTKRDRLVRLVRHYYEQEQGGAVLVYTTTRDQAKQLANLLKHEDIEARHYHGKISSEEKREVLEQFKEGSLRVVTATCAFGMGINRGDVRAVIHHTMSHNLEGYMQESGRAGRDDKPADCILLFDNADADTIFYLQSLNQLSEEELVRMFDAIRKMRDRIFGQASEDWFYITAEDLLQEAEFDEKFAKEPEQRDTKVKVALHYLEQFEMIERGENKSSYLQCDLAHSTLQASLDRWQQYATRVSISPYNNQVAEQLIRALHTAKGLGDQVVKDSLLDFLCDATGLDSKQAVKHIQTLQVAGVCTYTIPLTVLIRKGVRSGSSGIERDAKRTLGLFTKIEQAFVARLQALAAEHPERSLLTIHLRGLAQHLSEELSPHNHKTNAVDTSHGIRAETLMLLLDHWVNRRWLKIERRSHSVVRIQVATLSTVAEEIEAEQSLAAATLDAIYGIIGSQTGARLRIALEMQELTRLVNANARIAPRSITLDELENVMLALHHRGVLRIVEGLRLLQQALRVRVIPGAPVSIVHRGYPQIEEHYRLQTHRTHMMIHYGAIAQDEQARRQFVDDYFSLSEEDFAKVYPDLTGKATELPIPQADYNKIMGSLSETQREIVEANDAALAIIAGPGSGKTRTIIHRVAYLVKVRRVEPARILILVYNRNAMHDLRLRLNNLIGPFASRVQVYTFHGLALKILGQSLSDQLNRRSDNDYARIIARSCDLLEHGDMLEEEEDTQARRLRLLGSIEHIFVDEYQDVDEDMYRFIKLLAGLNDSSDETRRVHIKTCVIGDDDQNLYGFRGANARHIREFEQEFGARRMLLVENYRSTEAIIEAANELIKHNTERSKRTADEQVIINPARRGERGISPSAYQYDSRAVQIVAISQHIQQWIADEGVAPGEVAVMAPQWNQMNGIRLLLERAGIATRKLVGNDIGLLQHYASYRMLADLQADSALEWGADETVEAWVRKHAPNWGRSLAEPTMKLLCRLAHEIDQERGLDSYETLATISAEDIIEALYDFNEEFKQTGQTRFTDNSAVIITSCHSAKGLEFRKVIVLADRFDMSSTNLEASRRLLYVAMTRAKDELVLTTNIPDNQFIRETGLSVERVEVAANAPANSSTTSGQIYFSSLEPWPTKIGHPATRQQQDTICTLHEGDRLQLTPSGSGRLIRTETGKVIGALSDGQTDELAKYLPGSFSFKTGEVTLGALYHHLKTDPITGEIIEDWFVPVPQIRVFRI